LICDNCNKSNSDESRYCSECGNILNTEADSTLDNKSVQTPLKQYKVLRGLNWAFSALLLLGVALFLVSAKSSSVIVFGALAFLLIILGNYIGTAIALNSGVNFIMGIPLIIHRKSKTVLSLLIINSVLGLLGLVIIVSSLYTSQYGASISGFLYLFLSFANVRALWDLKKA